MFLASLVATCFATTAGASPAIKTFRLTLRGVDAVPKGDRGDSARAVITIDTGRRRVCWSFTSLRGLGDQARPRIGKAPAGKQGPILITLAKRLVPSRGCSSERGSTLAALLKEPSSYYIVLTNTAHPSGAVRAQF